MTWQPELYRRRVEVFNTAASTAPGFALMAIDNTDPSAVVNGRVVWNVRQPNATDETENNAARLLVNGPVPIPAGAYGVAYADWPSQVLHDSTDTLSFGDSLGCKSGSWYAWADYGAGFYLGSDPSLAADDQDGGGIETVWMTAAGFAGIKPLCRFTLDAALTTSQSSKAATITDQYGPGADNATAITVYNLETASGGTYVFAGDSGDAGLAMWDSGTNYRIIQLECP